MDDIIGTFAVGHGFHSHLLRGTNLALACWIFLGMDTNKEKKQSPTNMRAYRQQTDKKLLYLVLFTLVVVGSGLIALIWGSASLLTALPCLMGGALLILIPWTILTALEKWRANTDAKYRAALDVADETSDAD